MSTISYSGTSGNGASSSSDLNATTQPFDTGSYATGGVRLLSGNLPLSNDTAAGHDAITSDNNGGTVVADQVSCYALGTLIATKHGQIAVEDLRPGDHVILAAGGTAPIIWIGNRQVDCIRHPSPQDVMPVCVAIDAFGPKQPQRDLWLSPGHAVFLDGVLVPIVNLINGVSVRQERVDRVTYFHIELEQHDILLAEGLPAESDLDCDNRAAFENSGTAVTLHPTFDPGLGPAGSRWERLIDGPAVERARQTLLARLEENGAMTSEPSLLVMAGDTALQPDAAGGYPIPPRTRSIQLVSRSARPRHVLYANRDDRMLGLRVISLGLDGTTLAFDDPRLGQGWSAVEPGYRWTTGAAMLDVAGASRLVLDFESLPRYPAHALEENAETARRQVNGGPGDWHDDGHEDTGGAGLTTHSIAPTSNLSPAERPIPHARLRLLLDLSDLVHHVAHDGTPADTQRMQSNVALALLNGAPAADQDVTFLNWDAQTNGWQSIPPKRVEQLLRGDGPVSGFMPFDAAAALAGHAPSVLCRLGHLPVQPDAIRRVLSLKRRFGTRFVMMVHDLVPIYAPEACDPGATKAFDHALAQSVRHADHVLAISEHTAHDLRRYAAACAPPLPLPPLTVTRNGASFPNPLHPEPADDLPGIPNRFVLVVGTIEARKNHLLILNIWRRMLAAGDDPPHLLCVGRLGSRAEPFITALIETAHLDGRILLLHDIDDRTLQNFYARCLFTIYPSSYEGWAQPVADSLAAGKICISSGRSSLPEVAETFGITIDIDDPVAATATIRALIADDAARHTQEATIRAAYRPIPWTEVVASVLGACNQAASPRVDGPGDYPQLPFGTEIGFGATTVDPTARTGQEMLAKLTETRAGHFLSKPLAQAALHMGQDMRGEGAWAEPEPWGSWLRLNDPHPSADRSAGDLVLAIPPHPDTAFILMLKLRANGPATNQPVHLTHDGQSLWTGTIGSAGRTVQATLPRPPNTDPAAWWPVRLTVRIEPSPSEPGTIDTSPTHLGVERLIVFPQSDTDTRLAVLTKLARF